jgi:hypothetical protein
VLNTQGLHNILGLKVPAESPGFIIYSQHFYERLDYTSQFIFNHVLKVNYRLTQDIKEFDSSEYFKINYSFKELNVFSIQPHALISEKGITDAKPKVIQDESEIYLYPNKNTTSLHFDIFSAVFYFISRYEEWQSYEKDEHQRFEVKASLLFKNNYLLIPVVDKWIEELKKSLLLFYPGLQFPKKEFKVLSTIDVDNLFAYKHKGFLRTMGASLKDILQFKFRNLSERLSVLIGSKRDPFDIYESISEFCFDHKIPLVYFFLYRTGTKYDRTVEPSSDVFKSVFGYLKENKAAIGIHPSYYAFKNEKQTAEEIKNLSESVGEPITFSRQHYLRFDIRTTPSYLMKQGITVDFTMGFASQPGFRAGTSHPFYYYDFEREAATDLLLVPFCVMDGAYTIYGKIDPDKAEKSMFELAKEIQKTGGFFISVYHERSFSDHLYPGFGTLYKKLHLHLKELSRSIGTSEN